MSNPPGKEDAIIAAALKVPPAERAAFLNQACGGDARLRQLVGTLIELRRHAASPQVQPGESGPDAPTVFAPKPAESEGDRIGRYKLLQPVGEGGCGVVYMAEQEEPVRRRVALKVIKLGMDTKEVIARFEAERQALALMDHPNIAKVLDAGATGAGRPYFVMELVRGIKITDYCDQNSLTTRQRLDLFSQVCKAVQHAHQKGIIHRDLKPSNILVTMNDGVPMPKVIDFGIAKATQGKLTDHTLFTAFEQFIGTPAYMSPEQAEMSAMDIDTRSDIYSLGVLLYELLTGKTPFESKEMREAGLDAMRRMIREQDPVRPSTRLSTMLAADLTSTAARRQSAPPKLVNLLRGDLDWIVMKCLEKDRTRRYETATGLAADIQRHLDHEPVVAGPPGTGYRIHKFVRRHRAAVTAGSFVLLALLAGIAGTTWGWLEAVRQKREVVHQKQEAEREGRIARNITEFLTGMFKSIDPAQAKLREITVREILDQASARIGTAFPHEPLVELPIRRTMVDVYQALGRADLALPHAQAALELARTAFAGQDHADTARGYAELAVILNQLGRPTEALTNQLAALEMRKRIYHGDHLDVADSLNSVAFCLDELGRSTDALPYYEEAVGMLRRLYQGDNADLATTVDNVGFCFLSLGRYAEALPKFAAALEMRQRLFKDDQPIVVTSLNNYSACLDKLGRSAEALPQHEAALAMARRIYSGDHTLVARMHHNLAICLDDLGRSSEALPNFEKALEMRRRIYKGSHRDIAVSLNKLAACVDSLGRPADAVADHRDALAVIQKLMLSQPSNNLLKMDLAETDRDLGDVLVETGDAQSARECYEKGLQALDSVPQAGDTDVKLAVIRLGLRARLGLEEAQVVVQAVISGGRAEKSGLRNGDVVTRYAGGKITSTGKLTQLARAGKTPNIDLEITRDGKPLTLKIAPGKLDARLEERSISAPPPR